MALPSPAELRSIVSRSYELWSAGADGDARQAWLDHLGSVASSVTFEDPIGTPAKAGLDAAAEIWDRSRTGFRARVKPVYVIAGGCEVAAWCVYEEVVDGVKVRFPGAECWRFGEDGSLSRRNLWEAPAESPDATAFFAWSAGTGTRVPPGPAAPDGTVYPVEAPETVRSLLRQGYDLWNYGSKEEWLAFSQAHATDAVLEDPIGAPPKRGWHLLSEAWDHAPAHQRLRVVIEGMIVCGREAAVLAINAGTVMGKPMVMVSIDFSRRNEDGTRHSRTIWEPPAGGLPYAEWSEKTGG